MISSPPKYFARLALSHDEVRQAQKLRFRVFIQELGGGGKLVDHQAQIEQDQFDEFCSHLLLFDISNSADAQVVGAYRLLDQKQAEKAGQFYSETEYDLSVLKASGRNLLELGRTCVDPAHRNGLALLCLWEALANYVEANDIDILFGVASFHGTDIEELAQPLTLLYQNHLAPSPLRVRARDPHYCAMNIVAPDELDRRSAILKIPPLIKSYLRLGGWIGDGAFIDYEFNTTDVCLLVDTQKMNARQKAFFSKAQRN